MGSETGCSSAQLWNPGKKGAPGPVWGHHCQAKPRAQLPNLLGAPGTSNHLSLPSSRDGKARSSPWSWGEGMGRRPAMWPSQASPAGGPEGHEASFLRRTQSVNAGLPSSPGKPRCPPPSLCSFSVTFSGSAPPGTLTLKQCLYTPHSLRGVSSSPGTFSAASAPAAPGFTSPGPVPLPP